MVKRKPRWNEARSDVTFLTRCFSEGVSGSYGRKVWKSVLTQSSLKSQRGLARRLNVHHSLVNRGINLGQLDIGDLIMLLTDMKLSVNDLPDVPKLQFLAINGYLAAYEGLTEKAIRVQDLCVCLAAGQRPQFARLVRSLESGLVHRSEPNVLKAISKHEEVLSTTAFKLQHLYEEEAAKLRSTISMKQYDLDRSTMPFDEFTNVVRLHGERVHLIVMAVQVFLRVTNSISEKNE